jgi:hypothetical protein
MKNNLLLSTALIGGLMVGGSAIAQTTISGDLAITFKAQSYDLSGGAASNRGFGRESQVNFANKGKLSNGMNYAAGFSLEFDGADRVASATDAQKAGTTNESASISNENLFIDVEITPGTTLTVGVDHIQNITRVVPQVLDVLDHVAKGLGSNAVNTVGANPKENMGLGIVQAIPGSGLTASYNYTPSGSNYGSTDQGADGAANGRNSAYEYGIVGANTFGVNGLGLAYFKNKEQKELATSVKGPEGTMYQVSYAAQGVTGGYSIHKQNRTSDTAVLDQELKMQTIALTYAATKDITLGLTQLKTTSEKAGAVDETIRALQVGYNLGPVALIVSAADASDVGNVTGTDAKELGVRLTTKF